MTLFATPIEGFYNHKTPRFDGSFNVEQVGVLVIGESEKMYIIRLRMPVGNLHQGHEMSVHKHNVKIHKPATHPKQYDYSNAWWNN